MGHNYVYNSHRHSPGLFWPIIFIGGGVILLLSNMGLLAVNSWVLVWQLWPALLIVIGLDVMFGRRGLWGSVISAVLAILVIAGVVVLLFAAQNNPGILGAQSSIVFSTDLSRRTEHIVSPLDGVESADVRVDFHGGNATVNALEGSSNLIEGDVTYYGSLVKSISASNGRAQVSLENNFLGLSWPFFNGSGSTSWKLGLNPRVEYDLNLNAGSGTYQLDLTNLNLHSMTVGEGSGAMSIDLPDSGKYTFGLEIGSGTASIRVPAGVAAHVEYHVGSGSVNAPDLRQVSRDGRNGVYETPNYSQNGSYVVMNVDVGSGNLDLDVR
jgi:hypothetical protein